jgi:hypothetical protein
MSDLNKELGMSSWTAYPKVHNIGHPAIAELLLGEIVVQEKVDGSQISFGIFDGQLKIRSKSREFDLNAPDDMFKEAVETVKSLEHLLVDGWTYRGEYLRKPKHNAIIYNTIPPKYIILYDISIAPYQYAVKGLLQLEADRLGLMSVPYLEMNGYTLEEFKRLLETVSILGGARIEGIVIKNYRKFDAATGHPLFGKYVSEAFKEIHRHDWKESNPGQQDILTLLVDEYRSKARWQKAIQHIREQGLLQDSPVDIGLLIPEVKKDILEECSEEIKDKLFRWVWKKLGNQLVRGLPEWYKENLMTKQFDSTKCSCENTSPDPLALDPVSTTSET